MSHLTVLPGGGDVTHEPAYWDHPVHGARALEDVAHETLRFDDERHPYIARLAVSVLFSELGKLRDETDFAVCDNAMQDLAAYFSKPADDSCPPQGIERPGWLS